MMVWFINSYWLQRLDYSLIPSYHAVRFEKNFRYSDIHIDNDLLGDWLVSVTNGKINSNLGQVKHVAFSNFSSAFDYFLTVIETRASSQFKLIQYTSRDYLFKHFVMLAGVKLAHEHEPFKKVSHSRAPNKKPAKAAKKVPPKPCSSEQLGFNFN